MDFTFMGFPIPQDGYGEAVIHTDSALLRLDRAQRFVDMRGKDGGFSPSNTTWDVGGTAVCLAVPEWYSHILAERVIGWTMFEATKLPEGWSDMINAHCAELLVPCQWCADIFQRNGVKVKIHVVPFGIDPTAFFPLYRGDHGIFHKPYTFLWSGTPDLRKGWDVVYRAFITAFGESPDVKLILHFRRPLAGSPPFADANVEVRYGVLSGERWRLLLREADCFVFPSRGEGWGLPPREAAATGLPALVTRYGGLAEDLAEWGIEIGISGFSLADFGFWDAGKIGQWPEPDCAELAERMRRCVERPEDYAAFGARAASWLAAQGTWDRTARTLVHTLSEGT
jgi:glycosyltransferase involved in cell wall biosynthesis